MLYRRLDELREQAADRLTDELRATGGTLQARSQRDSAVRMHADQVEQFSAVESGLCFGRLDTDGGDPHYIGRIGIFDTSGDYDPLLMDWRAPAARAFYLATAANPQGSVAAGTCAPGNERWSRSTTRCWTWPPPPPPHTRS